MAENNSPPPLMTDKELLMETGAFNEIMNAAFEYADAYCASGDEPRRYSAAIDHLRKTVRAEITKFSRANYKTNAATEFDAQAVAAQAPAAVAVPDEVPESVIDAVAEALGDAYDCGRVWSAWGVGTMSQDDFYPVAEDGDLVAEIANAAISAYLAATPALPATEDSSAGDVAALIKKFRAVLTAEIHASIDPSSDIARQEGAIDTADHLLAEFNKIFPEA